MDEIKIHFSKTVADYDTIADKVVFENDELHNRLVTAISFDKDQELNILDLGCGTGHGMQLIANIFPKATITGIDFSSIMIYKSSYHLSPFPDRVKLLEMDFNDYTFDQKFDVIVSAIAIHNNTHQQKSDLFKKIYNSLNTNGLFINADFYSHESETVNNRIKKIYERFLRGNLAGEELDVWLKHAFEEDMPMTLSDQFSELEKAGFKEIKLLWIYNNEAIYVAKK